MEILKHRLFKVKEISAAQSSLYITLCSINTTWPWSSQHVLISFKSFFTVSVWRVLPGLLSAEGCSNMQVHFILWQYRRVSFLLPPLNVHLTCLQPWAWIASMLICSETWVLPLGLWIVQKGQSVPPGSHSLAFLLYLIPSLIPSSQEPVTLDY